MKIVICNSKKWFRLSNENSLNHRILNIQQKDDLSLDKLEGFQPDLVFFPHWSWIVGSEIYKKYKCIVFHTSPLPFGRGGSPIQNLIKRGYSKSPVSALAMSGGIDDGAIYDQEDISLEGSLSEILKKLNNAVNVIMGRLIEHLPEPIDQNGEVKTFKRLGFKDNEISYEANIEEFYNSIRMLDDPSYPSAYLSLKNVNIEFSKINKESEELFCQVRITPKELYE